MLRIIRRCKHNRVAASKSLIASQIDWRTSEALPSSKSKNTDDDVQMVRESFIGRAISGSAKSPSSLVKVVFGDRELPVDCDVSELLSLKQNFRPAAAAASNDQDSGYYENILQTNYYVIPNDHLESG